MILIDTNGSLRVLTDPAASPTFDGADDTLIGVLNLSSQKIASIPLHGPDVIFGFDGDGICSDIIQPHPANCPFGSTGYEGPGVTFSNVSQDQTAGTVNFNPPISANGGTAYFGLELAIQTQCSAISPPQPLKQGDPAWAGSTLGPASTSKTTIGAFGCFLTDLAMEINYYAQKQNQTFRTDPLKLNKFLVDNNGFTADPSPLIPFSKIPLISSYARSNGVSLFYGGLVDHRDDFTLDQFLCHGFPPMLYVGNPHWVLATGQTTHSGNQTYSDIDPDSWPNGDTLDNAEWNNTYNALILFSDLIGPLQGLYVTAHSPVELLLTAPDGAQTGFNPVTNARLNLIPSSAYVLNQLVDDETHGTPFTPELKELSVVGSIDGNYTLQVFGTGSGPFTIDVTAYDTAGTPQVQSFVGTATPGSSALYKIQFSSTPGVPLVVAPADNIPPTTVAIVAPQPNTNGWSRTNVTITLTATDNQGGSGVKQIAFSTTGAQPSPNTIVLGNTTTITIDTEGITNIAFFATDNAGNVENIKTITVKLDKTPPEAFNQFDPVSRDIVLLGRDALSGVVPNLIKPTTTLVSREDGDDGHQTVELRNYHVIDLAGNSLVLMERVRKSNNSIHAEIVSLQYNDGPILRLGGNSQEFDWQFQPDGSLSELDQDLAIQTVGPQHKQQELKAKFDKEKNTTVIENKTTQTQKTVKPGLVLLRMATDGGTLNLEF